MAVPKTKRSGGPKTESGKQSVARNALKTGAYSGLVVIPGESEKDFQELEAMLQKDFQVESVIEASIVHELAVLAWKRMRLERIEHSHIKTILEKKFEEYEFRQVGFNFAYRTEQYVLDSSLVDQYDFDEFRDFIAYMQELLAGEISLQSLIDFKQDQPKLFGWIGEDALELGLKGDPTPEILCAATYTIGANHSGRLIERLLRGVLEKLEPIVWVDDHAKDIEDAKEKIRAQRLLNMMQAEGVKRAHDDLAKSFYRTLSELRKHQSWRRKSQVIDVTPEASPDATE